MSGAEDWLLDRKSCCWCGLKGRAVLDEEMAIGTLCEEDPVAGINEIRMGCYETERENII